MVLAAGGGSRFIGSSHKLLALLQGRPVYRHALEAVQEAGFAHVIVVTGAVDLELGAGFEADNGFVVAHNPRWAEGQAGSLQIGIAAADALGTDAVVVGLADQPFIGARAWIAVASSTAAIGVATYNGVRANPVRLHRSVWSDLPHEGDRGARSLMHERPELVEEVVCSGSPADIDTMEDLQQWNSSTNSP